MDIYMYMCVRVYIEGEKERGIIESPCTLELSTTL